MKRFIRNIVILLLLAFSGLYTYQHAGPYLQRTFGTTDILPYVSYRVQEFINPQKTIQKDESPNNSDDNHTFNRPVANVYLDLSDPTLRTASIDALNAWNNTGAFTFKMINNKQNAQIIIKAMDDGETNAAGLTNTQYNSLTGHLTKATVNLNSYYLLNRAYGYNMNRIINTAEHELGHAIGLNHRQDVSVMYPQGSFYTIQPSDIQNVKKLYKEN